MININNEYFGLKLWVWVLIIIGLLYFWYINNISISNNIDDSNNMKNINKIKVYNFNTKWCGWSQKFQPEWDLFSQQVISDPMLANIEAYDIKCDDDKNMCEEYKVPGFPYIVIESDNKKTPYTGSRNSKDIINFIKSNY